MMKAIYAVGILMASQVFAQESSSGAVAAARMVVTVEAHRGKEAPVLKQGDVLVFEDQTRLPVTEWVPCQGTDASLELFLLIDDASDPSISSQFSEIRSFIDSQPSTTSIGVGYMRNGMVDMVQALTRDHARASAALRLPLGSTTGTNPYLSVSDLIHRWAEGPARREILMVTPGVGAADIGEEEVHNHFVDSAIGDAQRAGVIVYAIYALGIGHTGHSLWLNLWAQNYLAQLTEATGGEAYSLLLGAPISMASYLSDVSAHLSHQYVLGFNGKPGGKSGLQRVKLSTELAGVDLIAADRAYLRIGP